MFCDLDMTWWWLALLNSQRNIKICKNVCLISLYTDINSEAMNCNLKVNHYHTILLIMINSLITLTTCQIMPLKMLQIETIKQIIKATKQIIKAIKCNNWITHHHIISLVMTDSFVALSIWMINETNHNLNIEMKSYCYLALSISLKWMSYTEHIS